MAKTIKTGILERSFVMDRSAINAEKRTVELSFSSEAPVERWFGVEILDHSPSSVDLERIRSGGPLLMDHNSRDQIGVVESASVSDKRGKAVVRFGNSTRAQEVFKDVQDGIRSLVSVGYRVNTMVTEKVEKGIETMRATSWTPMEISLVSIPADTSVGVGRSVDGVTFETRIDDTVKNMSEPTNAPTVQNGIPTTPIPGTRIEGGATQQKPVAENIAEFRAAAERFGDSIPGIREMAAMAELQGWSIQTWRERIKPLIPMPQATSKSSAPVVKPSDLEHYSIARAINALGQNRELTGLERELNDEYTRMYGPASGFWLPPHVIVGNQQRTIQTTGSTLGAEIIQTSNLADQFIELLRNKAQVMRLGARTLNLENPVTIPRQGSAVSTNWVAETAASTPGTLGLQQITLSPKCVTGHMQYDKQLLITGNPSIDALVRDDILQQLGLAIDQAALFGGGSGEPNGVVATSGIGSITTGANGVAITSFGTTYYLAAISLETLVSTANADMGALAYLARSSHRGAMKAAQRFSSTDSPVWTSGFTPPGQIPSNAANDGVLNGYRAAVSNQIKTNLTVGTATTICSCIFFGNWNELLIGNFNGGAVDMVVDPYSLAQNRTIRVIASYFVDVGVRHAASFAILNGLI